MRLYFLDQASRALINVRRLKKHGYDTRIIVALDAETLDKLIILGNGSPEDEIVGIMSNHLNGRRTVGIIKSQSSGIASLDHVRYYASFSNVQKILFIIDQDDNSLSQFFASVSKRIGRAEPIRDQGENDRVKMYRFHLPQKTVDVIVVASGSDDLDTSHHEIEDHLLVLAGKGPSVNDPKEHWRTLNQDEKQDVFRLLKDRDLFEIVFHQHVCGCIYLGDIGSE
jgi:hypothetical protein